MALSTEHGFAYWLTTGTIKWGWTLSEQGQGAEGMLQVRQGLAAYRATGAELARPYWLALLAETHAKVGQMEVAAMSQNPQLFGAWGSEPEGISRRDFLNGVLLAAGGVAVGSLFPLRALAQSGIDLDPRALRGGNLPSAFAVGHWLRDRRLTISAKAVTLAPSTADSQHGTFPILQDTGTYDVIIVGSGPSGLAAAFYLKRRHPRTRMLMLDANATFGGNAARDDAPPIPTIASTAGAYALEPQDDVLKEFYSQIGIDWTAHYGPDPFFSYYFDDRTPFVRRGTQGWTRNVYGKGVEEMPYPPDILHDFVQAKQDFLSWYERSGGPTDPPDRSDPRFDDLAGITLHAYLTQRKGWHPAVADFYSRYTVDTMGGTSEYVNAHSAISFLGAEYHPKFSFPGGTSAIARHAVRWLIRNAIPGSTAAEVIANPVHLSRLDRRGSAVRSRQRAMAVRVDTGERSVRVVYYHGGKFFTASAKAVILAGGAHTAPHLVGHLLSPEARGAWTQFTFVPAVVVNVTLRQAKPLVELGLGYNESWWGSKHWATFIIADWTSHRRLDPNRPTVLTVYDGNSAAPQEMVGERWKLLTTPFATYEQSLREDLNRILAAGGFDFDRDVRGIYLYRWGHAFILPAPGFPFGMPQVRNGEVVRTPAPRHMARQQIGRISFGGQDTEGTPCVESAIASGLRTAQEALALL